jgi:hypothetical protein
MQTQLLHPLDCSDSRQLSESTKENILPPKHYRPMIRQDPTVVISLTNFGRPSQIIYRLLSALGIPFKARQPKARTLKNYRQASIQQYLRNLQRTPLLG